MFSFLASGIPMIPNGACATSGAISHTKHRKFWSHLIIAMLLYNLLSDVALPLRIYLSLLAPIPPTGYDLAFATGSHAAYFGFVLNTKHLLVDVL